MECRLNLLFKNLEKMKKYFVIALAVLSISSCNNFELDKDLQDPNNLTLEQADPNQLLNAVQLGISSFFQSGSNIGMNLTRMSVVSGGAFGSTYTNFVTPTDFWTDDMWSSYITVIGRAESLRTKVTGQGYEHHEAISQTIEAYTLLTLADYFGDIPLSEALKGAGNFNPKADNDEDVYAYAIDLLNKAKTNFAATPKFVVKTDFFYDNDSDKWTRLANTLLLKAYLNTGNSAQINTLIGSGNLMEAGGDFVFKFGTNQSNPDNRNTYWVNNYASPAIDYMANYFLWAVTEEKGTLVDPRRRYYFSRQVDDVVANSNTSTLPCSAEAYPSHFPTGTPFCYLENGYWGRDMGNGDGIPPDTDKRTVWGVYPFGGKFDNSSFGSVGSQSGKLGEGILPIMLANYVDFMKSEAALRLGTTGDARTSLIDGVTNNLNYVKDLFPQTGASAMTAAQITGYVTLVTDLYDNATTQDAKMEVIGKEYYLSLYGNGIEAYNLYRRTGKPGNMQPMKSSAPGSFPSSLMYPSNYIENNSKAVQKADNNVRVFWDTSNRVLF